MPREEKKRPKFRIGLLLIASFIVLAATFTAYMLNTSLEDTLVSERWRGPITFKTLYSDIISPSGTVPFTLVPNPATDRVEILFGSDMPTHYSLTLRDAHGRIVANTTGTTLQLGGLPSGVYFATLTTPFTTATRKLIIQHK